MIPNLADAGFAAQAEVDKVDVDIIAAASGLTGVISGAGVTAQGTPDMTVAVAAGVVLVAGVVKAVTSGNVTIAAADGSNPRFDLIVSDSTGAKQRRAGAAATAPVFPTPTAGDVVLAAVYVPAGDTAINSNQIVDKRVLLPTVYATDTVTERTSAAGVTVDGVLLKDNGVVATAATSKFGTGAAGATGGYVELGDGGDTTQSYVSARGSATDYNLVLQPKGAGKIYENGPWVHLGTSLAFFSAGNQTKQTVTGSRGGNAALASLLTALATYGLLTDSSTA